MTGPQVRFGENGMPEAPWELQEAVELWARESGRSGKLHCVPTLFLNGRVAAVTWLARLSLRSNDPRVLLFQQGLVPEPPTEDVWFHVANERAGQVITGGFGAREPEYRALDILAMGATGIREFLERGNTWSGRGEFTSLEDQRQKANAANEEMKVRNRATQKEESRHEQRQKRRHRLGIPVVPVGIDLKNTRQER